MEADFADPVAALSAAQGAVLRALEANNIKLDWKGTKVLFLVDGVLVAEYLTATKTLIWRVGGTSLNQDRLIKAHASLLL